MSLAGHIRNRAVEPRLPSRCTAKVFACDAERKDLVNERDLDRRRLQSSQRYPEMARGISYSMNQPPRRFTVAERGVQTLSSARSQPHFEKPHSYQPKVSNPGLHQSSTVTMPHSFFHPAHIHSRSTDYPPPSEFFHSAMSPTPLREAWFVLNFLCEEEDL